MLLWWGFYYDMITNITKALDATAALTPVYA